MKRILTVLLCLSLAGCATGYHSKGLTGGYSNMKLQDNIFKVTFNGNAYLSMEKARDFALLRSAEITIENGYKYFVVLEANGSMKIASYITPAANMTIECFRDKPDHVKGMIYDAGQIKTNIKKAYNIQ
jgi:hypothetical protein